MNTLTELLRVAAERHGERSALATHRGLRLETWTYRELWRSANAVARHLRQSLELEPGGRVVFWEANSPELVIGMFGALLARLVAVPIDPSATAEFVARVTTLTRAQLLVGPPDRFDCDVPTVSLADLPCRGNAPPLAGEARADDLAEIVFTSGTTGSPKGVMLTHRNIVSNVTGALELFPGRSFRYVSLLPLSHMFEQTVGLYGPLVLGSTIHYPTSRRPAVLLKSMRRSEVTSMVVVPQILELMLHEIEREVGRRGARRRWDLAHRLAPLIPVNGRRVLFRAIHRRFGGHLQHVLCGGARLAPDLAQVWERLGVRVVEGYGATECAPIVTANSFWDRCIGSVGRPIRGVAVEVADGGEILVKGPNVFAGYWEAPERTAAVVDADGWFHTGDLGEWDTSGRLRITGRLSDRIVLASGLNVYPEDVEEEILAEEAIADCVVVSHPDPLGNPRLWAVVIPATVDERTAARPQVEEAVRHAGRRLAPYQRVTGFSVWPEPEFPHTNLMKVKRFEVEAALTTDAGSLQLRAATAPSATGEIVPQLQSLLADIAAVGPGRITGGSDLTYDLGLDSLKRLELAVRLEDEFGIAVEDDDLGAVETVDSLAELLTGRTAQPVGELAAGWPRAWPARALRALIQHGLMFPLHRVLARPFRVAGGDALADLAGPVLLVSNHCSHADTPSILRALPTHLRRRTAVAAAADYFYRSQWLGGMATIALGTFPFSRAGAVRASLEHCGDLADEGWSILIFPEGTRSTSGAMAPFRGGIGLLATGLHLPIVPIALIGTHGVWPKGARRPVAGPITVRIGRPFEISRHSDPAETVTVIERAVKSLLDTEPVPA